ncbi:MAG TPA: serine/threonine-protein kinase [Burkholderiaceae bacterium]|jgi:serine/threonine-protein kinase
MSEKPGFWKRLIGSKADSGSDNASDLGLKRYRRERELGRGSMGEVWLAMDLQTHSQVALKMLALQREFSPEDLIDVRQRFMREAHAAGQLQHPDILQILDAGESGQDAWIVMEYVRGHDLSHYSRPGYLLPVAEALRLGQRLARALAYAHSHGVVHRDIKPANVMYDQASGQLKVMDFGIARVADGSRTRTGLVLGTPSFMSPEQLAGLKVDGRSDLFSLGVMLYQLLTGHLPHQSESMARLMQKIALEPPPDVRHFRPALPESLAMLLALALEKRPELRYASGEQLAQDIEAVLGAGLPAALATDTVAADSPTARPIDKSVDPFAQTQRVDLKEAGQNRAPPVPPQLPPESK